MSFVAHTSRPANKCIGGSPIGCRQPHLLINVPDVRVGSIASLDRERHIAGDAGLLFIFEELFEILFKKRSSSVTLPVIGANGKIRRFSMTRWPEWLELC